MLPEGVIKVFSVYIDKKIKNIKLYSREILYYNDKMTESCEPEKEFVELERDEFGHTEFFRYKIKPDGKCGYHAISLWLKKNRREDYDNVVVTGQSSNNTPMLSYLLQTVEYVKRNKNDVKNACGLNDKALERAVERVKKGDYMETEELTIICCTFGLIASVYDENTKAWSIINPRDYDAKVTENVIFLYNVTSSHFDLLEPVGMEEIKRSLSKVMTPPRRPRSETRKLTPPRRSLSKPRRTEKKKDNKKEPRRKKEESFCDNCAVQLYKKPYKSLKF